MARQSTWAREASDLWLYPISSRSPYVFIDGKTTTSDTSLDAFRRAVVSGPARVRWQIQANRRRVHLGDEIVVYYSNPRNDPVLIGWGEVVDPPDLGLKADWDIEIRWDKPLTAKMARRPVDARYLKQRLPQNKGAVMSLLPDEAKWVRAAIRRSLGP